MNNGRWYPSAITLPDGGVLVLSGSFATGPLQPPPNRSGAKPDAADLARRRLGIADRLRRRGRADPVPALPHRAEARAECSCPARRDKASSSTPTGTWHLEPGPVARARPARLRALGDVRHRQGHIHGRRHDAANESAHQRRRNDRSDRRRAGLARNLGDAFPPPPAQRHDSAGRHGAGHRRHPGTRLQRRRSRIDRSTRRNSGTQPPAPGPCWPRKRSIVAITPPRCCYRTVACSAPAAASTRPQNNVANPPEGHPYRRAIVLATTICSADRGPPSPARQIRSPTGRRSNLRVPQADEIAKVTWIRLGSVTHSFDQNQRLNTLAFTKGDG